MGRTNFSGLRTPRENLTTDCDVEGCPAKYPDILEIWFKGEFFLALCKPHTKELFGLLSHIIMNTCEKK